MCQCIIALGYDHILMIRSRNQPSDSTAAWALHERGAGIAAQCELVLLPAKRTHPWSNQTVIPIGQESSHWSSLSNGLLILNSDSDPRSCSQHPRHTIPPINLVSTYFHYLPVPGAWLKASVTAGCCHYLFRLFIMQLLCVLLEVLVMWVGTWERWYACGESHWSIYTADYIKSTVNISWCHLESEISLEKSTALAAFLEFSVFPTTSLRVSTVLLIPWILVRWWD